MIRFKFTEPQSKPRRFFEMTPAMIKSLSNVTDEDVKQAREWLEKRGNAKMVSAFDATEK